MERKTVEIPIADLGPLLEDNPRSASRECETVVCSLRELGLVAVRDPRVNAADNDAYLDLMERYYSQPEQELLQDVRPECNRQAGCMEWFIETAVKKAYAKRVAALAPEHRPFPHEGPNPFGRFFWHYGPRRKDTKFPEAIHPNIVPAAFAGEWEQTMNRWGAKMHATGIGLSQMLALGLDLPKDAFTKRMDFGQHLLSPTGCPLTPFTAERTDPKTGLLEIHHFTPKFGAVLSDLHDDFNFLTGHGPSRFPGLIAWTRKGEPFPVRVPEGCLLWQVGQQLERRTGGYFQAGLHQVAILPETLNAMKQAEAEGKPLVRVSSTFFLHEDWDETSEVHERFVTEENQAQYPPMLVGEHARSVFRAMNM